MNSENSKGIYPHVRISSRQKMDYETLDKFDMDINKKNINQRKFLQESILYSPKYK